VIEHVGFEVSDLERSGRFYDAVFFALGARRMIESEHALAYGINAPMIWIVVRGRPPAPGYGHLALSASGKAAVDAAYTPGWPMGAATMVHPGSGPSTGGGTTPPTCTIRTA